MITRHFFRTIVPLLSVAFAIALSIASHATAALVAQVNIQNPVILSRDDNKVTISFSINNREQLQAGVRYGVLLAKQTDKGVFAVDEVAYDEALTVPEYGSVARQIVYEAPKGIAGSYRLFLTSQNDSGFPFSTAFVDTIDFVPAAPGVEVLPETCTVSAGEAAAAPLTQLLTVPSGSALHFSCTAVNRSSASVLAMPFFETTLRSVYGETVSVISPENTPISFAPNERKTVILTAAAAAKPQQYRLALGLQTSGARSGTVALRYIVDGTSATIQNASLDRPSYEKGEIAKLSLIWSLSSSQAAVPPITMKASVKNKFGAACAKPVEKILSQDFSVPVVVTDLAITRTCNNPSITVSLVDVEGNTLDELSTAVSTPGETAPSTTPYLLIGAMALVLIIAVALRMRKKHDGAMPMTALMLPLLIGSMTLFSNASSAFADTYISGASNNIITDVTIDKATYGPGDPIYVTASISLTSGYVDRVEATAVTVGNATKVLIPAQPISGFIGPFMDSFTAPSATGSYTVDFRTGVDEENMEIVIIPPPKGDPGYYASCFIADTMVTLADGTKKKIQDVAIGDVLKGETSNNRVLAFHRPPLDDGLLYSINGGRTFVTAEHPFMTTTGWKSIDPEKTKKEHIGIEVGVLEEGDTLVTESGTVPIDSIKGSAAPADTPLYNFILDGDHTYYADGYLVHNKAACGMLGFGYAACGDQGAVCVYSDINNPNFGQPLADPMNEAGVCTLTCGGNPLQTPTSGYCPQGGGMYCATDGNKKCAP